MVDFVDFDLFLFFREEVKRKIKIQSEYPHLQTKQPQGQGVKERNHNPVLAIEGVKGIFHI